MRVGVIGGGLQGVGIALELSRRGASVDLFEKRESCLRQTSAQNEGKIHLGFVYARDLTLATARLMAKGALRFQPIIQSWIESRLCDRLLSSPFHYFVHQDSLLDPEELSAYYKTVSALVKDTASQCETSYFGQDAGAPVRRMSVREREHLVDSPFVRAVFQTPELAIDPEPIADLLRTRLAEDKRIQVHANTSVARVSSDVDAAAVTMEGPQGVRTERYDHVVNASWENLLVIDASAGVAPVGEWSFRVKYFLRIRGGQAIANTSSVSVVLGGFGDVVRYANGDLFLSWYPVGRRGLSCDIAPPAWPLPLGEPAASELRTSTHQELCRIAPWLSNLSPSAIASSEVKGGIIYALGRTDVDDPVSMLHQRHQVGVRSFGRYHTVDTGKFTLAPLFAKVTAERIMGEAS